MTEPRYDPQIEYLQRMLNHMGHDAGPVDGARGPATNDGIGDFIRDNQNIPESEQEIAADIAPARIATHGVAELLGHDMDNLVQQDIMALEAGLKSLGYLSDYNITNQQDPALNRAIEDFRQDHPYIARQYNGANHADTQATAKASFNRVASGQDPLSAGIEKYIQEALDRDMGYDINQGFNAPANSDALNCSGFVHHAIRSGLQQAENARDYSTDMGAADLTQTYAANQVKQTDEVYGDIIQNPESLAPNMIIGLDTGKQVEDWRYANIDHSAITYRAENGQLMVAESNGYYDGVRITPADEWLREHADDEVYASNISDAVQPKQDMDGVQIANKPDNGTENQPEVPSIGG